MEKKPIIVEAFKCPETGKVFTEREKYEEFAAHRAIAKKHRDEAIEFKREFNERFNKSTSVYQMLELIQEFFIKDATFRQHNGRPVDKLEVLLPGHPSVKIVGEFLILKDVLFQISHKDVYYKNTLIHREGFDRIINTSIDFILMKDKSAYTKNIDHSKFIFDMMIHLEAVPIFIEHVKRYDSLLLEKEKWEKETGEAAMLAIQVSDELLFGQDRLKSMTELELKLHKLNIEIDALTTHRATALSQLDSMKKQRIADIGEAHTKIALETPFEKQQEIEEIPVKDQIVYRTVRNSMKTDC